MSLSVVSSLLLILSAFLHALWNALVKKSSDPRTTVLGILIVATVSALATALTLGQTQMGGTPGLLWGLAAGFFETGYMIFLSISLERSPLGVAYTIMRGGAMFLVWVISITFLSEPIHGLHLLGVILVFAGLVWTNRTFKDFMLGFRADLRWAYLCGVFIAGYHLCYGQSMSHGADPLPLFSISLITSVPSLLIYNLKTRPENVRRYIFYRPGLVVLAGVVCASSFAIFLVGLSGAGAGAAITLRNTSIAFAQLFAFILGETITPRQWGASLLVMFGAGLLAWPVSTL